MDFTRDELLLMSEGVIKLIQDAGKAMELLSYDETQLTYTAMRANIESTKGNHHKKRRKTR